jgi:hypothetical protein
VVQAVSRYYRLQPMFNLTVDNAHTFFVGQQAWLVHIACNDLIVEAKSWGVKLKAGMKMCLVNEAL